MRQARRRSGWACHPPSGLRRYATLYEQVHGELPRRPNTQSRLYPGEALERLAAARQLVETERAKSILEALQALEERHINECRGDRLEDELRRLELAGADQARLRCRHERQHAPAERYCADERFYGVEAFVYRTALEVYNVDLTTYTLTNDEPVTETSPRVTQAIEAFVERRDEINAAGFNLRPADKMRAEPLTVFGNLFRRVNLTTTSPRNQAGRERRINEDALTYMRDLITARREREAERLGFWDADLERSVFETGYPYN